MENARSSGKMKAPKVRASNENVSPLQMEMDEQRERYLQSMTTSPRFQPFDENVGSPLALYLFAGSPISGKFLTAGEAFTSPTSFGNYRSAKSPRYSSNSSANSRSGLSRRSLSPLSSLENLEISPPMYGTPVKGGEEVFVMDDILVRSKSRGKNRRSSSSSSSGRRDLSSSSSASPWTANLLKTDAPRGASDESGNYSSKFARGKEDLHPICLSMMSKSEEHTSKSPSSAGPGIYCSSNSSSIVHDQHYPRSQPASPVKLLESDQPCHTVAPAIANPNTWSDWSPLDDGIEVVLPNGSEDKAPSREEVDSYISSVLNGQTSKRRLPVFVSLCKGDSD